MTLSRNPLPLILASRSARRRELLEEAGYCFEVIPADESAEDGPLDGETVGDMVARLAMQKAADVAQRIAAGIVIGCDTVADCEGRVLGKPTDRDDARRMLQLLRGRVHWVHSGLCVWAVPQGKPDVRIAVTELYMDPLHDEHIDEYLAAGAWEGKAGAFGYQDRLGWIHIRRGSASNVVGLPMELLTEMLARLHEKS